MTQPGSITNRVPPREDDIVRRIRDLERLVQQIQAALWRKSS